MHNVYIGDQTDYEVDNKCAWVAQVSKNQQKRRQASSGFCIRLNKTIFDFGF